MDSAVAALPRDADPPRDCPRCPRLVTYREALRAKEPDWWNSPVPGWGDPQATLAVVGLAPGVQGANRTGRAFTGDFAGVLLYQALTELGLARGTFDARADDGLELTGVWITNAVRCVPPGNKPETLEIRNCRTFLDQQLALLPKLRAVLALGAIAHQAAVKALGGKLPKAPFGHAAEHRMPSGVVLVDSYHTSRYNQNTGVLTPDMFRAALGRAAAVARG
jgi:uracil-DNA glycosylase family 4